MNALEQETTRRGFLHASGAAALAALAPGLAGAAPLSPGIEPRVRVREMARSSYPGLTSLLKTFVQKNAVPEATFAVGKNGRIQYLAAFRHAPLAKVGVLQYGSLFRLASVSKMFTAAAIQSLYDSRKLSPTTRVFPRLGITRKALSSQTVDPRINDITVDQLVHHAGGWYDSSGTVRIHGTTVRGSGFDPTFHLRDIAHALRINHPLTSNDIAQYMYGEPLQFKPGEFSDATPGIVTYSNFGYVLLGLLVEKVTGLAYTSYLQKAVLNPLNIHDVYAGVTARSGRRANEVLYVHPGNGVTVLNPASNGQLPLPYGGEFEMEITIGAGGLITSAASLVRFAAHHAVWGIGGRSANAARSGGFSGTSTFVESRGDGRDWAYLFDTDIFPARAPWDINSLPKSIDKYLDAHA